ncbi:hypothetical protein Agabi119p4_9120 [Agaricus bisporus var. burnettii]|uniref:Uncharacterized protein n=1 Tax=Agaricus bisporus var. burnettii TaxID=192524 RepID=A0A8H7C4R2_AGABI|nr:hypothetical protein Agabi119p4_9120 [Agaricus bisporus var. burnettii]
MEDLTHNQKGHTHILLEPTAYLQVNRILSSFRIRTEIHAKTSSASQGPKILLHKCDTLMSARGVTANEELKPTTSFVFPPPFFVLTILILPYISILVAFGILKHHSHIRTTVPFKNNLPPLIFFSRVLILKLACR